MSPPCTAPGGHGHGHVSASASGRHPSSGPGPGPAHGASPRLALLTLPRYRRLLFFLPHCATIRAHLINLLPFLLKYQDRHRQSESEAEKEIDTETDKMSKILGHGAYMVMTRWHIHAQKEYMMQILFFIMSLVSACKHAPPSTPCADTGGNVRTRRLLSAAGVAVHCCHDKG